MTGFATRRPVAILMVFLAAVVFGGFSYQLLPLTLMPELSYPTLTVRTEYPGAAPEEVENDISRPLEEALGVIGGLQRLSSVSRAGLSDVVLELEWDTDMASATQDLLEKLDLVFLPEEAKRPRILHYDPSLDPVMELSLSGEGPRFEGELGLRRLRRIADLQVKRALEPIKGIAAVRVKGGLEEEIHVLLDEAELRRTGIAIQQVIDRLAQENINVAGGNITEGRTEYMVRTLNEYQDAGEIAGTVVASHDGRDVRIGDLGEVRWSHLERQIVTRTDGGESVQIEIFKEADANIVALAKRVKEALGRVEPGPDAAASARGGRERGGGGRGGTRGLAAALLHDEGVKLQVVADRSLFIESSLDEVRSTAVLGGLLAVLVLFLFLRDVRATVIIAVSIPISILITFAPLHALGVTLNIMSLGGLALGIGMLVDSSIVVLESIFRCREEGDGVVEAAVRGTDEVRGAVFASTMTTIAVFFPMVFVEGIAGQAFGDLGLAVVTSLLASLVVALWFIPMLASRQGVALGGGAAFDLRSILIPAAPGAFLRSLRESRRWVAIAAFPYFVARLVVGLVLEVAARLALFVVLAAVWTVITLASLLARPLRLVLRAPLAAASGLVGALQASYAPVARWALRSTPAIVLIVAGTLAATVWVGLRLDSELLPEVHQGEFTVEASLPVGTPLERTDEVLAPVEAAILAEREHIRSMIVTLGFDVANMQRADEGEHTARFKVLLEEGHRDAASEAAVVARIRRRLAGVPDIEARVVRPVLFSARTPIEVEVHGDDLVRLRRQADRVREVMASLPELADVETTLRSGAPEVQVVYDRDPLARYGLRIGDVARLVRDKVKGNEATRFNRKDRRIPVVVRLQEEDRDTVSAIRGLTINPGGDRPIPLSAVARVSLGEGPSEVRRIDGQRVAVVSANLGRGSLGSAAAAIERALRERVEWPPDMTFFLAGQNQEWERSQASLWLALGLSVFLVYVIMAAQFESLAQPLVIMFTIPLAFFGTLVTLRALDISLSVVVFLGMIMLAGIVVNNAIVLVDYINTLRARGVGRDEAIVAAGTVRLRPILLTTATTVLGLLPMALGLGDGAEIRTPMAIAVISGLVVSTVLTLVVIPAVYAMVDRASARLFGAPAAAADAAGEPGALADEARP